MLLAIWWRRSLITSRASRWRSERAFNFTNTSPLFCSVANRPSSAPVRREKAAVSGKAPSGFAGLIIGFIVYGIIILVGPITGASLNPARELAPAILGQAIGATPVPVEQLVVVYIFGSTIGAVVGAFAYEFIGRELPASAPAPASVRDTAVDAA